MNSRRAFRYATWLIPIGFTTWVIHGAISYPEKFLIFAAEGITSGALYALIAFGIGLIYTSTGILNLAHGEVFMIAAVTSSVILVDIFGADSPSFTNFVILIFVYALIIVLGAGLSATTDLGVFRKLRRAPRIAPLIASLGIALILQNFGIKINGSGPKKINTVFPEAPPYYFLDSAVEHMLYVLAFAIPALVSFSYLATKSRNGLAIGAVATDHDTSRLMGINVNRTITRAFLLAGAAAGAAGLLYAQEFRVTDYSLGMRIGLLAYAAAIIGGVNRIAGTIFGGFFIGILQSLNIGLPSGLGRRWSETLIYSVLILMLVYRPQGIFGHHEENV